jgi:hypothetical protein
LKLAPRNKKVKTMEKHRKGRHMQRKISLVSMGNEASKRVNIIDIFRKVTYSVMTRTMKARGILN